MLRAFMFFTVFSGISVVGGIALSMAHKQYVELEHHKALANVSQFDEQPELARSPNLPKIPTRPTEPAGTQLAALSAPVADLPMSDISAETPSPLAAALMPIGLAPEISLIPLPRAVPQPEAVESAAPVAPKVTAPSVVPVVSTKSVDPDPIPRSRAAPNVTASVARDAAPWTSPARTESAKPSFLIGVYR